MSRVVAEIAPIAGMTATMARTNVDDRGEARIMDVPQIPTMPRPPRNANSRSVSRARIAVTAKTTAMNDQMVSRIGIPPG